MKDKEKDFSGCLHFSTNALSRILTKMADEEFAISGLSSSYGFLLMLVNEESGIRPKEISEKLFLNQSTVTRLVDKMEARGFLRRKVIGRNTSIKITKKGEEKIPLIEEAWENLKERYSKALGRKESNTLASAIYMSTQLME
ncbi:MAG: MarR family transcriptional regulator [Marinilabiliales bacterium]|nr:MAG: MarR family transcriptional regulator [Marinilabiliales bacterium]